MPYEDDRARADKAMADVLYVLRTACDWTAEPASVHLDRFEATDVIANGFIHVAVRSRSIRYLAKYGHEFTLRSRRRNGVETELIKIRKGFADYLLYGFLENVQHRFFRLIDLGIFRTALECLDLDAVSDEYPNKDGETFLRAFDVNRFGNFRVSVIEGFC